MEFLILHKNGLLLCFSSLKNFIWQLNPRDPRVRRVAQFLEESFMLQSSLDKLRRPRVVLLH